MKSVNLNLLEPPGPLQACNGTALPLPYSWKQSYVDVSSPNLLSGKVAVHHTSKLFCFGMRRHMTLNQPSLAATNVSKWPFFIAKALTICPSPHDGWLCQRFCVHLANLACLMLQYGCSVNTLTHDLSATYNSCWPKWKTAHWILVNHNTNKQSQ